MDSLATLTELCEREGIDPSSLTPTQTKKLEALLRDASAFVRRYTGQTFTLSTHTATLLGSGQWTQRLPQRPVRSIVSINGDPVDVTEGSEPWKFQWNRDLTGDSVSRVVYTAGYDVIPDDIVGLVCGMVQRTMNIHTLAKSGVSQHAVGPYSISFASWAVGGNIVLSPAEKQILSAYKIPTAGRVVTR